MMLGCIVYDAEQNEKYLKDATTPADFKLSTYRSPKAEIYRRMLLWNAVQLDV